MQTFLILFFLFLKRSTQVYSLLWKGRQKEENESEKKREREMTLNSTYCSVGAYAQ